MAFFHCKRSFVSFSNHFLYFYRSRSPGLERHISAVSDSNSGSPKHSRPGSRDSSTGVNNFKILLHLNKHTMYLSNNFIYSVQLLV